MKKNRWPNTCSPKYRWICATLVLSASFQADDTAQVLVLLCVMKLLVTDCLHTLCHYSYMACTGALMGLRKHQMPGNEWFTYTELEIIQLVIEETGVRKNCIGLIRLAHVKLQTCIQEVPRLNSSLTEGFHDIHQSLQAKAVWVHWNRPHLLLCSRFKFTDVIAENTHIHK